MIGCLKAVPLTPLLATLLAATEAPVGLDQALKAQNGPE
jgi:hypothetical protein